MSEKLLEIKLECLKIASAFGGSIETVKNIYKDLIKLFPEITDRFLTNGN